MADLLNKIPTNVTEYPNSFKRQGAFPLEAYEVHYSLADAKSYASSNPLAYVGQTLAVVDSDTVNLYIIEDAAGTLKPVGAAISGDNKTITLKDGILSLYGDLDDKADGTYVPSLINGVLTWAEPDTSTATNQQQAIDALEVRADAIELTLNGKEADEEAGTQAVKGLIAKVDDNFKAIQDEITDRSNADAMIIAKIGDVDDDKNLVAMISEVESKIPTQLSALTNDADYQDSSQVQAAIVNKADKATSLAGYGITDAYTKQEVDSAISSITHFTAHVVNSTDEVVATDVLYLIKDYNATGKDVYNEYIFIEGLGPTLIGDTTTDLSNYVSNEALVATLVPYAKTVDVVLNSTFDTFKIDNTKAISDARTGAVADIEAKAYATETFVSTQLAIKADIENTYSKAEINDIQTALTAAINTKADQSKTYTKDEINALLADIEGGSSESAASVARDLDAYKTSNNARVDDLEAKVGSAKVGQVEATGLFAKVDTAQAQADENAAAITALEVGPIKANADDITNLYALMDGIGAEGEPETILAAIQSARDEAIAAIPALTVATDKDLGGVKSAQGENMVAVNADGTMTITSVNVKTLTQDVNDLLILNGGNATT